MEPYFPRLSESFMSIWEDFQDRRTTDRWFSHLTEEECAITLTSQINHRLTEDFESMEGVRIIRQHRKPVFVFREALTVTVKKMRTRFDKSKDRKVYIRSNYPTKRTQNYWDQQALQGVPDLPRFIFGYHFLKEITEVKLFIAYARSKSFSAEWIHPINEPIPVMKPKLILSTDALDSEGKDYEIVPSTNAKEGQIS